MLVAPIARWPRSGVITIEGQRVGEPHSLDVLANAMPIGGARFVYLEESVHEIEQNQLGSDFHWRRQRLPGRRM